MPSPVASEQAILNGLADGNYNLRVSALSPDAGNMRVSAFGVNIADVSNSDAGDFRVSSFQTDAANLRVSAFVDSGSVSAKQGDAASLRVSAIIDSGSVSAKSGDASALRASAIVDSGSVSAKSNDADQLRMSGLSKDAGLFRVSAIGGTAGDRTLVDGTTQSISATLTPISANPAATVAGLVSHVNQPDAARLRISAIIDSGSVSAKSGDAANLRISAIIDNGSVSAKSGDASSLRTSALITDAEYSAGPNVIVSARSVTPTSAMKGLLVAVVGADAAFNRVSAFIDSGSVSAKQSDGANLRMSAVQSDAGNLQVSGKSGDAGTFRVSAIGGTTGDNTIVDGETQSVSANIVVSARSVSPTSSMKGVVVAALSPDAQYFRISAIGTLTVSAHEVKQSDAASLRVSAIIDNGSVSAKSSDAGTFRVSAIALSAFIDNGSVSAKSSDGGTFRVSAIIDNGSVSAKSSDAGTFLTSAKQGDAGLLRTSAIQGDAGIQRVSAIQSDGVNLNISAKSGDASNLRISSQDISLGGGIANTQVTVQTSSAALLPWTPMTNRKTVLIRNYDLTNSIYIGGTGLTTANGLWLSAKESVSLDISENNNLSAVATGAAVIVGVLELK